MPQSHVGASQLPSPLGYAGDCSWLWYALLHSVLTFASHLLDCHGPTGLKLTYQSAYAGSSSVLRTEVYQGYAHIEPR